MHPTTAALLATTLLSFLTTTTPVVASPLPLPVPHPQAVSPYIYAGDVAAAAASATQHCNEQAVTDPNNPDIVAAGTCSFMLAGGRVKEFPDR